MVNYWINTFSGIKSLKGSGEKRKETVSKNNLKEEESWLAEFFFGFFGMGVTWPEVFRSKFFLSFSFGLRHLIF